jgi:murein DD-endopeptidase MepM/ murein hydrolase activator NlpD
MTKLELFYPTKPLGFNQKFGNPAPLYTKQGMKGHNGIDFLAKHGQPVYASHDGEIVYSGADANEGWGVVLRTTEPMEYMGNVSDGIYGNQAYFKTIYWHLIKTIPVKVGQKIKAGDLIGYADNTGASSGDHLHFGLKPQRQGENDWTWANIFQDNGYFGAVDAQPYFNGFFAIDAQKTFSIMRLLIKTLESLLATLHQNR